MSRTTLHLLLALAVAWFGAVLALFLARPLPGRQDRPAAAEPRTTTLAGALVIATSFYGYRRRQALGARIIHAGPAVVALPCPPPPRPTGRDAAPVAARPAGARAARPVGRKPMTRSTRELTMFRRPNDAKLARPWRLRAAALGIGTVLAATIGGGARGDYDVPTGVNGDKDPPPVPAGNRELDQARARLRQGDSAGCLERLRAVRAQRPELPPPAVLMAEWLLADDQAARAREALERAAVEEPAYARTYLLLAQLALREGRATEAALLFEKAEALAGDSAAADHRGLQVEVHAGLAAVAERREDWAAAASALAAWLRLEPGNGRARARWARALFRQGKRAPVFAELQRAVRDDSTLDPPAIVMARLHTEAGERSKAAAWVEYAVQAAPRDPRALVAAALWHLEQDHAERATALADAAAKLDPDSAAIKRVRGLIAWHAKDYPATERLFREVFDESPGDLEACAQWALALAEQAAAGKRQRALQLAELGARLDSTSGAVLTALGWAYYRNGRPDDAERTLRAALASGSAHSETTYYLARVLADRGQADSVGPLLKLGLDAPGAFAFRKEARDWLAGITK